MKRIRYSKLKEILIILINKQKYVIDKQITFNALLHRHYGRTLFKNNIFKYLYFNS